MDTVDAPAIDPAVQCSACAAVCCRLPVMLLPGDRVPSWLATQDQHGLAWMAQGTDGWCAAVDRESMRCTIHPRRPQVCRDFDMGGVDCRGERDAWRAERARIPLRVVADA